MQLYENKLVSSSVNVVRCGSCIGQLMPHAASKRSHTQSLHSIAPSLSHSLSSAKAAIITLYEQREIVFLFVQSCSKSLKLRRLSLLYIGHIVSGLINKNFYKITKK